MNNVPTEYRVLVAEDNGQPITTSLKVAEHFGKRHSDILRAIKRLECSREFNERNFASVEYVDAKGQLRPSYQMTKNGFIFLAMGLTGRKAAAIKEAYIRAFDWMADQINGNIKHAYQRLAVVERAVADMNASASEGGRRLAFKRWHSKPLEAERDRLWSQVQPMLPSL